jgi:hypothetical protein
MDLESQTYTSREKMDTEQFWYNSMKVVEFICGLVVCIILIRLNLV